MVVDLSSVTRDGASGRLAEWGEGSPRARRRGGPARGPAREPAFGDSGRRPEGSDASAAAVADADLLALDDDRHRSTALRDRQHLVEERLVVQDVVVLDLEALVSISLTGRGGIGSGVLAEYLHALGHRSSSYASGPGPRFAADRSTGRRGFQSIGRGMVSRGGLEPPTR